MFIKSLSITNFRAIKQATLDDLTSMVVIAGTNGSGKSTIFDAIRLLKSTYGSIGSNEPDQWFNEFQMPLDNTPTALLPLFNDKTKPLSIRAFFGIDDAERTYLREKARELVSPIVARDFTGYDGGWVAQYRNSLSRRFRQYDAGLEKWVDEFLDEFLKELKQETFEARFSVKPGDVPDIPASRVLEVIFSTYQPADLGGLRYHSAQRNYTRELLRNVSINIVEENNRDTSSWLYGNTQYTNIKQEMATAYVKELVAKDANVELKAQSSINATLKELFSRFFIGKEFLGPRPNASGNVYFPVKIGSQEHDLDDLSSGEKEIVYGYLRMRNTSPKSSIVLIDEPELHLNPMLIGGLPDFYHRHLGSGLGNQLWLVTHSDTLLRESLGRREYSIFHMVSQVVAEPGSNQAVPLLINEEAQRAVYDLVGDWAAYRPGAKLVIFEGGGDTDFDVRITGSLFPKEREEMNFLSGGGRQQGVLMHAAIETSDAASDIRRKVYSVTDKDSSPDVSADGKRRFMWDRYHIENYLLDPECIAAVVKKATTKSISSDEIYTKLRDVARTSIGPLVRHRMLRYVREAFGHILDTSVNPNADELAPLIRSRIEAIPTKLAEAILGPLDLAKLRELERNERATYDADLASDAWMSSLRGRDILKRFRDVHLQDVLYEPFVNLIIDEMVSKRRQPEGMSKVMKSIATS